MSRKEPPLGGAFTGVFLTGAGGGGAGVASTAGAGAVSAFTVGALLTKTIGTSTTAGARVGRGNSSRENVSRTQSTIVASPSSERR